jgi:hypothetical protein
LDIEQIAAQAELDAADQAIRRARAEEISYDDLLAALAAARIAVPVAGAPGATWLPASVTTRDGTFLVAAFTQTHLAAAFCHGNRDFPRAMLFDLAWVLESIPPTHGILFNMGGDNVFEWEAPSVAAFREKLRQAAS